MGEQPFGVQIRRLQEAQGEASIIFTVQTSRARGTNVAPTLATYPLRPIKTVPLPHTHTHTTEGTIVHDG